MTEDRYQSYQETPVKWLKTIPSHWEVRKLKFLATIQNGQDYKNVEAEFGESSYPVFGSGGAFTKASQFLYDGESVLFGRKGTIDKPLHIHEKFWTVDTMFYSHLHADTNGRYFYYQATTIQYSLIATQTALPSITQFDLSNYFLCFPPLPEQTQIARFLDYKTAQLDQLIAQKQALIERLNEQRIALITQAVTRGLNPDAALKDSGVEWLGQVPKGWEVKPVKFMTRILRGKFTHRPRNDPAFYDGDYPFIQTGDISRAGKYVSGYSQTLNEKGYAISKEFPAGTLVMTIAANIGDMAILDFNACFPDSIVGFVPDDGVELDYLYYLFVAMKKQLLSTAVLNTQLNLNIDRIGSIPGTHPPKTEQLAIVEFLEKENARIDAIKEKISAAITRLEEYRTALITAAVTGKIDVREFELPEPATAPDA